MGSDLQANQALVKQSFEQSAVVPVFALSTHGGRNTIKEDAIAKARALIAGGATKIEFLNRGDKSMPLYEYTAQLLQAIEALGKEFKGRPEISFGVGTVADAKQAGHIAIVLSQLPNKNGFMVSAHQSADEVLAIAEKSGVSIISTCSKSTGLKFLGEDGNPVGSAEDAYTVEPGQKGVDELDPEYIKKMRAQGQDIIKIFNAEKIGAKHAGGKIAPEIRTLHTLIATAKAYLTSYAGAELPSKFFAMGTGGLDATTIPVAVGAMKSARLRGIVEALISQELEAGNIRHILNNLEFGTGGTFITAAYDAIINAAPKGNNEALAQAQKEAATLLEQTSRNVNELARLAREGIVRAQKEPMKLATEKRKTLIFGEPLVQYSQKGKEARQRIGTAGDSFNYALDSDALQAVYGKTGLGALYFATAFGDSDDDRLFTKKLFERGIDHQTFSTTDEEGRVVGSYTRHRNADGSQIEDPTKANSYNRDNAAARFYWSRRQVDLLKKQIIDEGITQIVGSHIMLGNCDNRELQLEFFNFAKAAGVEVIWADNYRAAVWKNSAEAARYSALAMRNATRAIVSYGDEKAMHSDASPLNTAKRLHKLGVKQVVITDEDKAITISELGADGKFKVYEVIPAPLKAGQKNSAGAGDSFAASITHFLMSGDDVKTAAYKASLVAREVIAKQGDYLEVADLPPLERINEKPFEFETNRNVETSVRFFYLPEPDGSLDYSKPMVASEEAILTQIKAAKGITAVTTSIHTKKRSEPFTAWDIVRMIRHIEYDWQNLSNDPLNEFASKGGTKEEQEANALEYLQWLQGNGTKTGIRVMNFEDSRTSDSVKYGDIAQRDKDIDVECENLRVLSQCGLNSEDRAGFCYTTNFMTPFDWFRTDMDFPLPDGSRAMAVKAELLAMFDRYVLNIEPEDSQYYSTHYAPDVLAKAERLWKQFGETSQGVLGFRKLEDYQPEVQAFIKNMLAGNAGSSETEKYDLATFRERVRASRYLGQDTKDPSQNYFKNDTDGQIAHKQAQENMAYYGKRLSDYQSQYLGAKIIPFVFHPDDTADTLHNRGDMGVFRVASTPQDILHIYNSGLGINACTGCYGSARAVTCEADVLEQGITLIKEHSADKGANLSNFIPFLHLRRVAKGDESLDHYNPTARDFVAKIQDKLSHFPGSIAELPHHVALTPLLKTLQVLDRHDLLKNIVIRPDHTTTIDFHLDYGSGQIVNQHLGRPGYDATRIMSSQMIRIMVDAIHNLEPESVAEFITHFENKLCSFGISSQEGYKDRLRYLRQLDFGHALMEYVNEKGFQPTFKSEVAPQIADGITSGRIVDARSAEIKGIASEREYALAA